MTMYFRFTVFAHLFLTVIAQAAEISILRTSDPAVSISASTTFAFAAWPGSKIARVGIVPLRDVKGLGAGPAALNQYPFTITLTDQNGTIVGIKEYGGAAASFPYGFPNALPFGGGRDADCPGPGIYDELPISAGYSLPATSGKQLTIKFQKIGVTADPFDLPPLLCVVEWDQEMDSPVINVKDVGAVADSFTDDSEEVTVSAALAMRNSDQTKRKPLSAVYFPRGTYFLDARKMPESPDLSERRTHHAIPIAGDLLIYGDPAGVKLLLRPGYPHANGFTSADILDVFLVKCTDSASRIEFRDIEFCGPRLSTLLQPENIDFELDAQGNYVLSNGSPIRLNTPTSRLDDQVGTNAVVVEGHYLDGVQRNIYFTRVKTSHGFSASGTPDVSEGGFIGAISVGGDRPGGVVGCFTELTINECDLSAFGQACAMFGRDKTLVVQDTTTSSGWYQPQKWRYIVNDDRSTDPVETKIRRYLDLLFPETGRSPSNLSAQAQIYFDVFADPQGNNRNLNSSVLIRHKNFGFGNAFYLHQNVNVLANGLRIFDNHRAAFKYAGTGAEGGAAYARFSNIVIDRCDHTAFVLDQFTDTQIDGIYIGKGPDIAFQCMGKLVVHNAVTFTPSIFGKAGDKNPAGTTIDIEDSQFNDVKEVFYATSGSSWPGSRWSFRNNQVRVKGDPTKSLFDAGDGATILVEGNDFYLADC